MDPNTIMTCTACYSTCATDCYVRHKHQFNCHNPMCIFREPLSLAFQFNTGGDPNPSAAADERPGNNQGPNPPAPAPAPAPAPEPSPPILLSPVPPTAHGGAVPPAAPGPTTAGVPARQAAPGITVQSGKQSSFPRPHTLTPSMYKMHKRLKADWAWGWHRRYSIPVPPIRNCRRRHLSQLQRPSWSGRWYIRPPIRDAAASAAGTGSIYTSAAYGNNALLRTIPALPPANAKPHIDHLLASSIPHRGFPVSSIQPPASCTAAAERS
jgi:hypothetical protein